MGGRAGVTPCFTVFHRVSGKEQSGESTLRMLCCNVNQYYLCSDVSELWAVGCAQLLLRAYLSICEPGYFKSTRRRHRPEHEHDGVPCRHREASYVISFLLSPAPPAPTHPSTTTLLSFTFYYFTRNCKYEYLRHLRYLYTNAVIEYMASQAAIANSASFQQDSVLVARYAADRRGRGMSVSSHTSNASISEEETAYSSGYGSGVATPVPVPNPNTTEPAPTKPQKYIRQEGVTVPATERSPLLPRRMSTERHGHARRARDDEAQEQEWTWWDELKTLSSYVIPVYGYVPPPPFLQSVS